MMRTNVRRQPAWTEEILLAKIQAWYETYGTAPTASDWNPRECRKAALNSMSRAHSWLVRAIRFDQGEWPWSGSVVQRFGTWNEAVTTAGLEADHVTISEMAANAPQELSTLVTLLAAPLPHAGGSREQDRKLALIAIADAATAWATSMYREAS